MLQIRAQQMQRFREYMLKWFEDQMVTHLSKFFPHEFRAMGEPAARELIKKGIQSAAQYGIEKAYCVSRYIDLMIMLSPDFDRDARFPWAAEILADDRLHPRRKMDQLDNLAGNKGKLPSFE